MSKKHPKLKFPHLARLNPAWVAKPLGVALRWSLLAFLLALNVYFWGPWTTPVQNILGAETGTTYASIQQELVFWQEIAQTYPDYKDAYRMIATLAYEIREDEVALEAAERVLKLDPNDKVAREIYSTLSSAEAHPPLQ